MSGHAASVSTYTPSQKFRGTLQKVRRLAKVIHLYQDKIVRLSDAENVERGGMYALEMKFGVWRRKQHRAKREKLDNWAPAACFTNAASRTSTVLESFGLGIVGERHCRELLRWSIDEVSCVTCMYMFMLANDFNKWRKNNWFEWMIASFLATILQKQYLLKLTYF